MFSSTYIEARDKFRELATRAKFTSRKYVMPNVTGPSQEELSTDVAYFIDPANTKKLLVMTCGVHGIEGYGGSAAFAQFLTQFTEHDLATFAEKGIGIVLVHAANPHGFAYGHRVDRSEIKDGVVQNLDPNRNCLDYTKELPTNPGYQGLENKIIPQHWSWWSRMTSTASLLPYFALDLALRSSSHFYLPVFGGQHTHPDGLFFGGTSPGWTCRVMQEIIRDLGLESLPQLEKVVYIDWHTGIGSSGECQIYPIPDKGGYERVNEALSNIAGAKVCRPPYPASGTLDAAMQEKFSNKDVTSFTFEFGTLSPLTVANALRGEACLSRYGNAAGSAEEIMRDVRAAFYPENDPKWKAKILTVSKNLLANVFTNLLEVKLQQDLPSLSGQKNTMFQPQEGGKQKERVEPVISIHPR